MFLRMLLLLFAAQKTADFLLSLNPSTANYLIGTLGMAPFIFDNQSILLVRLWGVASLVWALLLFRASLNAQYQPLVMDATIIGFLGVGLVGLMSPMPVNNPAILVRGGGGLLIGEALLLMMVRFGWGEKKKKKK